MSRRGKTILSACLTLLLCCIGLVPAIQKSRACHDSGSPETAEQWKAILQPISDPAEAQGDRVEVKRFTDGTWVMGLSQDSHAQNKPGGGTIAVKDSRGAVRAFFGHVCGPEWLGACFGRAQSLDGLYARLQDKFQEYEWPQAASGVPPANH